MSIRGIRRVVVPTLLLVMVAGLNAAFAATGPWIVVANSGDGSGTAINLSNGEDQRQTGLGAQVIGVAVIPGVIAFSDFGAGRIKAFQVAQVGQYIGAGRGQIVTTPENAGPEGITPIGEGSRALISDGGTLTGGTPVSLLLVDLANLTKISSLPLPSVYGVAYNAATRTAWVLDGASMQVAAIFVAPDGSLHDTGARIDLHGTPNQVRFIALYAGGSRLLVSHKTDGAVEVLDTAYLTSLGRIEGVGTTIGAIAVTPDGARALVGDFGASRWAVLDLGAYGVPVDTGVRIPVPAGTPNTFVGTHTFSFVGDKLYFSSTNGNVISALDWKTLTLLPESYATGVAPAGLDLSF